jgi:hypothetical protein
MVAMRLRWAFGFIFILTSLTIGTRQDAEAGWVASNLGLGGSFNELGGYSLNGPAGPTSFGDSLAVEFQVSGNSSVMFGAAELALQYHSGLDNVQVLLMSDAGGTPGAVLDAMDLTNLPFNPSLVTVAATEPILLNPGVTYWLAAVASDDSSLTWMMNDQGDSGHLAYQMYQNGAPQSWVAASPGSPDVAFQIDAVAAPASGLLVASGMLFVATFGCGTRQLRRFVRTVNRGRRRRTYYRYYY